MKHFLTLIAVVGLLAGSACSSGTPASRSDYANPAFGSRESRRAAREAEIRKLHPDMTEKQVSQQLASEFPVGQK